MTEVGDSVEHLNIGDRVAYASARPGAYSDMRNLDATQVCKLPEDVSFKVGAAVMLKGLTRSVFISSYNPSKSWRYRSFPRCCWWRRVDCLSVGKIRGN